MILLLFGLIQNVISQGISLALSDLKWGYATGWSATASDGTIQSEYDTISTLCNNYIFTLNRNFQKYSKTYTITHYEFYQLFIEFEVYFYQFTQTTISIQVNTQIIYQQTFTTQNVKLNNNCGPGQDSQYTIQQGFYTKEQTLLIQIEYIQNVMNAESTVGISNLNIYSNGIPLIGGCPMNTPFNLNDVCQTNCPSTQYYLGGDHLNECLGPQNGNSFTKQILTTDNWSQENGGVITNNGLYPNIMNNQKFSSQYASDYYFMSIVFSRTQNCKLQLQFIFYIFGEWDDQSIVTIVIGNGGMHPLFIAKYYGIYQSSTLSGIYFTNLTTSTGQQIVARKTLITLQVNYYQSSLKFTFKQSIIGSGSFGFSDIIFYDAVTNYMTTIFDLTCPTGYQLYRGICYVCPVQSVTSQANGNCTDYSSTESKIFNPNQGVDLFGYYLIKLFFYQDEFYYTDIANTFTILPPQLNNYYNGQNFSYIQGYKILGGKNSWGYGAYGMKFSNLQPHVQLRIYFTLYLLDNFQSGDQFEIYIDGNLVLTRSQITQTQFYDSFILYYYATDIEYKQPHYQSKLQIIFLCNIAQKDPSKASCGISDLFVLIDQDVTQLCNGGLSFSYQTSQCEYISSNSECYSYVCTACANSICSECSSLLGYVLSSGGCDCDTGFFYSYSSSVCIKCHYTCATCNGADQTNCLTCDTSRTLLQSIDPYSQTCPCNSNYYDFESKMVCYQITSTCHYSCLTCFGIQDYQCLSCPPNSLRTLTTSNQCLCNSGYLEIGVSQCFGCDSSCLTCYGIGNQNCLSCDSSSHRFLDSGSCLCSSGFNNVLSSSNTCVSNYSPCHYSCLTCYGSLNIDCLTCDASMNRLFQQLDNSCKCNQNYIDNGVATCSQNQITCHSSCQTCSGPSNNQCNTCSLNRTLTVNNCPCSSGFNEIVNPGTCVTNYYPCHISCDTCYEGLANNCLTCSTVENRVFDLQTATCDCMLNYNDLNGTLGDCQQNYSPCDYSCNKCFGPNQNQCLDCQSNHLRTYNSATQMCDCQMGYNSQQAQCTQNCHNTCFSCFGPLSTNCSACDTSIRYYINGQCKCIAGTNDFVNPPICATDQTICSSPYILTCFGNLINQAISCDLQQNRIVQNNNCICYVGYFEDSTMSFSCSPCHFSCQICQNTSKNCQSCSIQNNRVLIDNTCYCLQNYNEVNQALCISCSNGDCLTCDLYQQCLICKQDYKRVENGVCVCNDGYYQGDNNCFLCDSNCLTCFGPLDFQCQSCHIKNYKYLSDLGSCECMTGYQENYQKQCVYCNSDLGKAIVKCLYADPFDGVWTYGEQCDDGNTYNKDGCANFQIQSGFNCLNEFNQQSICYKCQDNCVNCDLINKEIICLTCQDSYYNNQKQCIQCMDSQCKQCNSPFQCEVCFNNIFPKNGKCNYCESGYYLIDTICQPKCGDGIKTFNEPCDDGNNYSGDGCSSNCQLEVNYVCNIIFNQSNCVIASPPILQIYSVSIIQQDMRRFTILSSQSVYYSNISLQIISNQSQFINLQYVFLQNQNILTQLQIDANLTFLQSLDNIEIQFNINGLIKNQYQQEVSDRQLIVQVKNILILQQSEKQISSQINQASQGSVSALAITSILQLLLLGSTQLFIQLLNILQQLYYIQYINIQFPPNFTNFFQILSGFNIDSVSQFVNLNYITTILNLVSYAKPPLKFQQLGINAYFLINIQHFITQLLLGIIVYLALKLLIILLDQVQFQMNDWFNKHLYKKIKMLINKLVRSCNYIRKNGFISLILANCYDIQFAIQLQLSAQDDDFKQTLNQLLAYGFLLFYGYIIIKLNQKQDEELNFQHIWQNKLNQIQMIQAFIFMFSIVNLQDNPELQVIIISLSSLIIVIYTQQFSPFKNFFNNFKLIIQELCMFLNNVSFTLYIYSPIQINSINLGWFQLGLYCLMIIGNILIEAYSNAIRIQNYYQQSKKQQQIVQKTKKCRVITE